MFYNHHFPVFSSFWEVRTAPLPAVPVPLCNPKVTLKKPIASRRLFNSASFSGPPSSLVFWQIQFLFDQFSFIFFIFFSGILCQSFHIAFYGFYLIIVLTKHTLLTTKEILYGYYHLLFRNGRISLEHLKRPVVMICVPIIFIMNTRFTFSQKRAPLFFNNRAYQVKKAAWSGGYKSAPYDTCSGGWHNRIRESFCILINSKCSSLMKISAPQSCSFFANTMEFIIWRRSSRKNFYICMKY